MAERHLPTAVRKVLDTPVGEDVDVPELAPIQVRTSDEVRDVADTLNVVQSAALELAVDQAMLRRNVADAFVNLARRNQNLISRQLDFITELERNETRTGTLDNLFRLDHHATRMRRNAESLLVLAGVEAARKWGEPVSLLDVVRAAVGEVEDFQRVTITTMDTAMVVGSVASDLAHLMAELIENALHFSPPDLTVEVNGRIQPGHYLLLVIDEGMGMGRDDLRAANDRLQHGTAFTVAPSRYLGHHVAGSLARRHGITVHLHNTPCSGITASVEIPTSLLAGSTLGTPDGAHAQALRPGRPAALPPAPAAPRAVATADVDPFPMPVQAPAPAPAAPPVAPRPAHAGGPIPVGPAALSTEPMRKPAIWPATSAPANGGGTNGGGTNGDSSHPPAEVETVDLAARGSNGKDSGSAPPLAHRVPGAQAPQTEVHGLRRAPGGVAVAPDQPLGDMYQQLSQYADGIERGRHHEDEPVSDQ
jgi:hypothetical protein